jgi:hypothetical protein
MSNTSGGSGSSGGSPPAGGGRGSQQQRRQRAGQQGQQRSRYRSGQGPNKSSTAGRPAAKKFTGKEDGLGDEFVYFYTSGREATDQFARTSEEVTRYCSTKYKSGADVSRSLDDGTK